MLRYLIFLLTAIFILPTFANANCNFVSANFLDKLSEPLSINSIIIETKNIKKFNKNSFRILTSKFENIHPKYKKKFSSKIIVKYDFGECIYKGSVRQNGDWKDHIIINNGKILSSLVIKLNDGNILNATKFKLLIPNTRNNLNEVFGTILLKELGFITPETFQVHTNINNNESIMLFQEDTRKEMLEKNNRREGPIFEGDESILWSYKKFKNFELSKFSLTRMINKNWFLKGVNSQEISLDAYKTLQQSYLYERTKKISFNFSSFDSPNVKKFDSYLFEKYFLFNFALNGFHGLSLHNRKFYYNVFLEKFEPIYYDGGLKLLDPLNISNEVVLASFSNNFKKKYETDKIDLDSKKAKLLIDFKKRVLISDQEANLFFKLAFRTLKTNLKSIEKKINNTSFSHKEEITLDEMIQNYIKNLTKYNLDTTLIHSFEKSNKLFLAKTSKSEFLTLTNKEIAQIISNNQYKGSRVIYLPNKKDSIPKKGVKKIKFFEDSLGEIVHSEGMKVNLSKKNRKIIFYQFDPSDWALIKNANLNNWDIEIVGKKIQYNNSDNLPQRFNNLGLTGCLTFYKVIFDKTSIKSTNGKCEDSINIVSSVGNIKSIDISESFSDALDVDFSNINIDSAYIKNAGNDCVDFSGGNYILKIAILNLCKDKGISIGEKSKFNALNIKINFSDIAVSSKDSSITIIENALFENVNNCFESAQKKNEFFGGQLKFGLIKCNNLFKISEMKKKVKFGSVVDLLDK